MNPNDPAFPVEYKDFQPGSGAQVTRELAPGLTIRAYFAIQIVSAMCVESVTPSSLLDDYFDPTEAAVYLADKLIAQLSKTEAKE